MVELLDPAHLKNERLGGPKAQEFVENLMCQLTNDILNLHRNLQTHGLFLQRECAQRLHQLIMKIAKSYHWLARQVMVLQVAGFSLKAKYHCLKDIAYQLRKEIVSCSEFCASTLWPSTAKATRTMWEEFVSWGEVYRLVRFQSASFNVIFSKPEH